ncbi:MAG: hypothetical protein AAFS10_13095 [Myxococcota bacterium]
MGVIDTRHIVDRCLAIDFTDAPLSLADLITKANDNDKVLGSVCHSALGLVSAKAKDGSPLIKGRNVTGVTDQQIKQLGIEITPLHPEAEMRKVGANFESQKGFVDMAATHVVVDGNIVTGQAFRPVCRHHPSAVLMSASLRSQSYGEPGAESVHGSLICIGWGTTLACGCTGWIDAQEY